MGFKYQEYKDEQLLQLIQQNDTYAFETLYKRHWSALYGFARRFLGDDDDAKDAVQDCFLSFYRKREQLHSDAPLKPYLFRLIQNALINTELHKKVKSNALPHFTEYYEKGVYETDNAVREREMTRLIDQEVENLPPQMRKIYDLSRNKYLNHKEIATKLNIAEATVAKQLQYALKRLRSKLGCMFWLSVMQAILWLNRSL